MQARAATARDAEAIARIYNQGIEDQATLETQHRAGVAEFSIYAARAARGRGAGRMAMKALIAAATQDGFWKLLSRVFPENVASRTLLSSCGFREVGVYEKHGKRNGVLMGAVIVERLLP
jgi:phosphinothricin acetyltransferase